MSWLTPCALPQARRKTQVLHHYVALLLEGHRARDQLWPLRRAAQVHVQMQLGTRHEMPVYCCERTAGSRHVLTHTHSSADAVGADGDADVDFNVNALI